MNNTVLVTGGSGFIGTVVCKHLVKMGYSVFNVDRVKKEIDGVTMCTMDIASHQIDGFLEIIKPHTIIHLAASHEVGKSVTDPGEFYENNVANTIVLLNKAVKAGVKNFVFSSTSSVYGNTSHFPTSENVPLSPESPYAQSKAFIEELLPTYEKAYGLKYVTLRYFNAAGAATDHSHGYTQTPSTHLIPNLCRKAISGETLEIYGGDYTTKDGTAIRDYTHVADISDAHIKAMKYLSNDNASTVFNIGSGHPLTVLDVVTQFEKITGAPVNYNIVSRRGGDIEKTCADILKAEKNLGWRPAYDIDKIIEDAYAWEKKQKHKKQQ